jgi:DNA modification methylase
MILHGDCLDLMSQMSRDSVDAIVTDPPYGLGFMGKEWDKPGRAARSTTTAVEGEHSPYSAGKAEYGGASYGPGFLAATHGFQAWCEAWATEALRILKPGGHLLAFGGTRTYHRLAAAIEDAGFEIRDCLSWLYGSGFPKSRNLDGEWQGYGTALKPAHEPIVLARKPLTGTVAQTVQEHGTGALNIDGTRIGMAADDPGKKNYHQNRDKFREYQVSDDNLYRLGLGPAAGTEHPQGRWPANLLLDEQAAAMLDEQSGESPARFFYTAKASRAERGAGTPGNHHPTVKPIDLMRWLVRLVTPPGGTVLDPFTGSGTTGIAAGLEGMDFIGIEQELEYLKIARARMSWWIQFEGDTAEILARAGLAEKAAREHDEAGQLDLLGGAA